MNRIMTTRPLFCVSSYEIAINLTIACPSDAITYRHRFTDIEPDPLNWQRLQVSSDSARSAVIVRKRALDGLRVPPEYGGNGPRDDITAGQR
ncbi:hypothetical protein [Nonomuraea sp. B19D2]|uniref:hypothetical protein n=1 Tax=Nonomuraea sp. B19D2 TaxID=3159561 RepID=UPI0032DA5918